MVIKVGDGFKGLTLELLIRKKQRLGVKLEVRVLLSGESGSGKSTLLAVLKSG
jgi:ABC-type lipoprotein export system ATPase subunit